MTKNPGGLEFLNLDLASIHGLPKFAVSAIIREIKIKINQWKNVSGISHLRALLPPIFDNIEDQDFAHMMTLISKFSGRRVYIPKSFISSHILVRELGEETTDFLTRNFGGSCIEVPHIETILLIARNKRIKDAFHAGKKIRDISIEFSISPKRVKKIVRGSCVP